MRRHATRTMSNHIGQTLTLLAATGLILGATIFAASAQDYPEVFPTPHEPTRSASRLTAPPGTIPSEAPRGGISFDLFGGPAPSVPQCEDTYAFVEGERRLVSVRCRD